MEVVSSIVYSENKRKSYSILWERKRSPTCCLIAFPTWKKIWKKYRQSAFLNPNEQIVFDDNILPMKQKIVQNFQANIRITRFNSP